MLDRTELLAQFKKKVMTLSKYAWEDRVKNQALIRWLGQFDAAEDDAKDEQLQMAFLLSQFIYFGSQEIKHLLKTMYRQLYRAPIVRRLRMENSDTLDEAKIEALYRNVLESTVFIGVGNPSESGTHLLYYFRQENKLSKDRFIGAHRIFSRNKADPSRDAVRDPDIAHYVFIDDLCASGTQAKEYSEDILVKLRSLAPEAKVSYLVLFATREGIEKVRRLERAFDHVECVVELDSSYKCFTQNSRAYASSIPLIDRTLGEQIARRHGQRLWPTYPLGYKDGQLLLGFNHNTPDNTLPIIWSDEPSANWVPIFRRYPKE